MASRVNVKFVIILSTVLVLFAAGVGYLAINVVFKSAEDLAGKGDARMAEGDHDAAAFLYSKAVNKDPYNDEYLLKWREAMSYGIPATDQQFSTDFRSIYMPLHNQLALSDQMGHPEYQIEYLDLRWGLGEWSSFNRGFIESIAEDAGEYITIHEASGRDPSEWIAIRRYRGKALSRIAAAGLELTPEQSATADADLRAALELDPSDYESLEFLLALKQREADVARQRDRTTRTNQLEAEFDEILSAFVAENAMTTLPGVRAEMLVVQESLNKERRAAIEELGSQAIPRLAEIGDRYRGRVGAIGAAFENVPADEIDASIIRRLRGLEQQTDPESGMPIADRVMELALAAQPDDPHIRLLAGQIHKDRAEFELAREDLNRVLALPSLPLSLEGMVLMQCRVQASYDAAETAVRAFVGAEDEEARARWLALAKEARADLSTRISDSAPQVRLLDARLAYAEGDPFAAQRLVDEYNAMTNDMSSDGLWLAAQIAKQLQQVGTSQAALEKMLQLNPRNTTARIELANLHMGLNRFDDALEQLYFAQESAPNSAAVLEMIANLEKQLGRREADSPVEEAILEARRKAAGSESEIADVSQAIQVLRDALAANGPDTELIYELVRYQLMNRAYDDAAETVATGLASFPDDAQLREFESALAAGDDVEAIADLIRGSGLADMEKHLQLYQLYRSSGMSDRAIAEIEKGQSIDPDNPLMLELEFQHYYALNDLDRCRALVDRAEALNADRVDGLTFRARALLLEGQNQDALDALVEASQRDPNNASTFRIMGNVQMLVGQQLDAFGSFQKALTIRPNDRRTTLDFCRALMSVERFPEALEVARRAEPSLRSDMGFMDLLLELEGRAGDKETARTRRESILVNTPDNFPNRYALVALYIDLGRWDLAQELIASTREAGGEEAALIALEARWWAERNDINRARNAYARYISEADPSERIDRYLELGQFMHSRGEFETAIRAFRQAVLYEEPDSFRARTILGDSYLMSGRDREAADTYKEILAGGGDTDGSIAKRAAEALIRTNNFTEADQLLSSVADGAADVTVNLLRADAWFQRGNDDTALEILDEAVVTWPEDARVWLKRAEILAVNDDQLEEALLDIEQALQVREFSQAHAQKATILARLGRDSEAFASLREAVRLNPALDDLRIRMIVEAIRVERQEMARDLADEWFELRPRDVGLRSRVAELFALNGMNDDAVRVLQGALAIERQPAIVLRLTDLLYNATPPKHSEAEQVFIGASAMVATDPSLLMSRARLYAHTNRVDAAINDCNQAFGQIGRDPPSMMFWFTSLRGVFEDQPTLLSYLQRLASQPGGVEWSALFRARVLMYSESTLETGLGELQQLITSTREPSVRYAGLRALAGHRYDTGEFEQAVTLWRQALSMRGEDWQLENNIAYALASKLDRAEEALPFAELAARHAPNIPEPLDTLGAVYLKLGRPADAIEPLTSAVRAAGAGSNLPAYLARLAEAKSLVGDAEGASDLVSQVEALLDRGMELDDQYVPILEGVRARLNQG